MLQSIRDNSQSIVAKIIVGLIIVTFALFGVESLVSLTAGSNAPASVNGEEISERDLLQGVELQRRQLLAQMGENADPTLLQDDLIGEAVLERLIEEAVLVQSAQNQNMRISDQLIDQLIVSTSEFQLDGRFDRSQFEATLRNAGLSPLMYRDILRKEKLMEQERFGYLLSSFILPSEVEKVIELDRQVRDVSYFTLPIEPFKAQVSITDDQLKAAYEEQKASLMTDEQVVVDYLLLDREALVGEVVVSDDDLQSQYQALLANFEAQEARGVSHILLEITDEQDDAAAKAKADALYQRLQSGEDFASLAKEASDDIGSSETGGDLGVNTKGAFDEAFEDALFALAEVGDFSEPVRTDFGYHLIKLTAKQKQEAPQFADVEAELRQELSDAKADELYVAQLKELEDISFSAGDLVEPAEVMGLKIQTSKPFSRVGSADGGLIGSNPRVVKAAFGDEVLKEQLNSSVIELDRGRAVVVHLNEHLQPRAKDFDEVATSLREQLAEKAASEQLKAKVDAALAELAAGKDIISVSGTAQLAQLSGVDRGNVELPMEVRAELFRMAHPTDKPTYKAVELFDGSYAIVALEKVSAGEQALADRERTAMQRILSSRNGQNDFGAVVEYKKSQAEIERL